MALRPPRKLGKDELRDYAAAQLAARALSSAELRAKLRKKAAREEDVEALLNSLKEYGAVDDRKFAGHYAEARANAGQYGKQRVLADLLGKRVSSQTAREAVEGAFSAVDEPEAVERWLARKYRNQNLKELLQQRPRFASVYRRLRTAGFSSGAVLKVLNRISGGTAEWEAPEEAE